MEYRPFGRTGMRVSSLCLGTMMFGPRGTSDVGECGRIIGRALEAGINFVDSADVYSDGESERIVGKALASVRDEIVLATKFHWPMGDGPNRSGNSRRWIMQAVDASLQRLQTDWIDIYQVHRADPECDLDETLGALSDLVRAGKIRYAGTSTFPAHQLVEAQWLADRHGHVRLRSEQPPYSLLARGVEADVLPVCQRYGIGVLTWSPLAGGWLSGLYRGNRDVPVSRRQERLPRRYDMALRENQRKLEAADALATLADEAGLTLVQLAVAFVASHPAVSSVIVGPRTREHLHSYLQAVDLRLDNSLLDRIDEVVAPGQDINPADAGWEPPELTSSALRRRQTTT